jgi:ribosome biogenesis GTPase
MKLAELGYNSEIEDYRKANGLEEFTVGRVIAEHKERYIVKTEESEYLAEVLGNLRYTAQSRADFPAVGDWVAMTEYDGDNAIIHTVLPRRSVLARQAVGSKAQEQIIATNIDFAFIIQAVDRDFSVNRIERYLAICNSSTIDPVIILNKIDLVDNNTLTQMLDSVQKRVKHVPVFTISNKLQRGLNELIRYIEKGKTYCLLGSSGVGKSTLLNSLAGEEIMKTKAISEHTERGRHITTHRELRVLKNGGILIDNPGMREVGLTDLSGNLEKTFEDITVLAENCKFKDCHHTTELGCAVIAAVEDGRIERAAHENYLKMEREKEHYEASIAEKRQKDRDFGKMVKQVMKAKRPSKR